MPSLLDLTNSALSELGRQPEESLNPATVSPQGLIVQNKILELYKEVLLDYNWNFAVVYVQDYSPLTTNFSNDFVYSYALPGDYGKFYQLGYTGADWPIYAIWDGMMLANTLPIQYYYISNDIPFENWPPLVARQLVLYAASKCAPAMTNNMQLAAYLYKEYLDARTKAILENDMENPKSATRYNDFDRITFV